MWLHHAVDQVSKFRKYTILHILKLNVQIGYFFFRFGIRFCSADCAKFSYKFSHESELNLEDMAEWYKI